MNLQNQDLRHTDLSGLSLTGADLSLSNLTGVDLSGRNLGGANFSGATLVRANLTRADLSNAVLNGADFTAARLMGANLIGAKMSGAKLRRAKLIGARFDARALEETDTLGAALPAHSSASPMISDFLQHATSMAWNDKGDLVVTGGYGLISVWDVHSGQRVRTWQEDSEAGGIVRVACSANGRFLASCNGSSVVKLWDLATAEPLRSFAAHTGPINRLAFSSSERLLAIGGMDGAVKLWDVDTSSCVCSLAGHSTPIQSLAFSSDGRFLASGSKDATIQLWQLPSQKRIQVLQRKPPLDHLIFSPDGHTLASSGCGTPIQLWDTGSGQELPSLDVASVHSVAYSPDGKTLATGGEHGISLWSVLDGSPIRRVAEKFPLCVGELAFDPSGQILAANSGFVKVWEVGESQLERDNFVETSGGLVLTALSTDGKTLAVATHKILSFWDARRGFEIRRVDGFGGAERIAFSSDLQMCVTADRTGTVQLWECNGKKLHPGSKSASHSIECLAFHPAGQYAALGGRGGVTLYDLTGRRMPQHLRDRRRHQILSLAFDPKGLLLAGGASDGRVVIWNLQSFFRCRSRRDHTSDVRALGFSPDGTLLASGGSDSAVKLFDTATGKLVRALEGHSHGVSNLAFSPTGQLLLTGGRDSVLRQWDVATGQLIKTISVSGRIVALAFGPTPSHLLVALSNSTIQLYRLDTFDFLAALMPLPEGWVVFDAKGRYRFSGNISNHFWHVVGLCRFEPGELDEFMPGLRLSPDESLVA